MASLSLQRGERFVLPAQKIYMGLRWDVLQDKVVDLDAACVAFDTMGNLVDGVYFNELSAFGGAMTHSGDNKTGFGEGDDELIVLDLPNLPAHIGVLMVTINCFPKNTSFVNVETAMANVRDSNNNSLLTLLLGCSGSHTGYIVCKIFRSSCDFKNTNQDCNSNNWEIQSVGESAPNGRSFMDMVPQLVAQLNDLIDPGLFSERSKLPLKNFNLKKRQPIPVPEQLPFIKMGLGWDVCSTGLQFDLDASVLVFDRRGDIYDEVYFAKRFSKDNCINHAGDNRTGEGEGDDEVITIDLGKLSRNITSLIFTVNIYTKGVTFSNVRNAYARIFTNDFELCRFTLDNSAAIANKSGLIMCQLFRDEERDNTWKMEAIGASENGSMCTDLVPYAKNFAVEHEYTPLPSRVAISIHEAKDLPAMDSNGFSDPYCIIKLSTSQTENKTHKQKKTLNPVWEETFYMDLCAPDFPQGNITISCFDYDRFTKDDLIGNVIIPYIVNDAPNNVVRQWFPISTGRICISVNFQ